MNGFTIVIQQRVTKRYFRSANLWVTNPAEALNFSSTLAAINFSVLQNLGDVEIVFVKNVENVELRCIGAMEWIGQPLITNARTAFL